MGAAAQEGQLLGTSAGRIVCKDERQRLIHHLDPFHRQKPHRHRISAIDRYGVHGLGSGPGGITPAAQGIPPSPPGRAEAPSSSPSRAPPDRQPAETAPHSWDASPPAHEWALGDRGPGPLLVMRQCEFSQWLSKTLPWSCGGLSLSTENTCLPRISLKRNGA